MDAINLEGDSDLLKSIEKIVGRSGLLIDSKDTAPYLIDQKKEYNGRAVAIVKPKTTEELSKVVSLCSEKRIPIVPQGGNTGLCGGATPDNSGKAIVISLSRMNTIRAIDPLNYTITVDAGVILADIQKAADDADRLFPLSLGAEGSCQIGGNLATNAGGTGVLRYGTTRELALGLEFVMPNGKIWNGMTALRKDNTGYDLKHLFMGSEGTLGIITGAVLKLFPKPKDIQTAFVAIRDSNAAIDLLARARSISDDRVTAFEWIARRGLDFVLKHIPDTRDPLSEKYSEYLLIEMASGHSDGNLRENFENILGKAMEDGLILDAVLAESEAQAKDFWRLRETIPEAQMTEGATIKHDISVPVSKVPEFLRAADSAIKKELPDIRICAFGHVGDGNVHYNVTTPENMDREAFFSRVAIINRTVHDEAVSLGGSISAEHGIGVSKRQELTHYKSVQEIEIMRTLKAALDPQGIMNPGKVL
jgi:FAD/FMN-containing dehydrogenase